MRMCVGLCASRRARATLLQRQPALFKPRLPTPLLPWRTARPPARSLDKSAGALTDFEVFRLLKSEARKAATERELLNGARRTAPHVSLAAYRNLTAVRDAVHRHLEPSPCAAQSEEQVADFIERTRGLGLTTAELLQCINRRPTMLVELFLIIDECDQRLDPDAITRLLANVVACFPDTVASGPTADEELSAAQAQMALGATQAGMEVDDDDDGPIY